MSAAAAALMAPSFPEIRQRFHRSGQPQDVGGGLQQDPMGPVGQQLRCSGLRRSNHWKSARQRFCDHHAERVIRCRQHEDVGRRVIAFYSVRRRKDRQALADAPFGSERFVCSRRRPRDPQQVRARNGSQCLNRRRKPFSQVTHIKKQHGAVRDPELASNGLPEHRPNPRMKLPMVNAVGDHHRLGVSPVGRREVVPKRGGQSDHGGAVGPSTPGARLE